MVSTRTARQYRLACETRDAGLNYLCPGLKRFYAHIQRDMPQILRRVEKERGMSARGH